MKTLALLLVSIFGFLYCTHAEAKNPLPKILEGTISELESADNFYLTIIDKKGFRHTALCLADLCEKLIAADDESLGGYKGKKVQVTLGRGNQVDGSGQVMGTMEAFVNILLIK